MCNYKWTIDWTNNKPLLWPSARQNLSFTGLCADHHKRRLDFTATERMYFLMLPVFCRILLPRVQKVQTNGRLAARALLLSADQSESVFLQEEQRREPVASLPVPGVQLSRRAAPCNFAATTAIVQNWLDLHFLIYKTTCIQHVWSYIATEYTRFVAATVWKRCVAMTMCAPLCTSIKFITSDSSWTNGFGSLLRASPSCHGVKARWHSEQITSSSQSLG